MNTGSIGIDRRIARAEMRLLWSLLGAGITSGLTLAGLFVAAGYFRRGGDRPRVNGPEAR